MIDKVGFVAARVDELAYRMTLDPGTREGALIVNVSTLSRQELTAATEAVCAIFDAGLSMGRFVAL